MFDKPEAMHTLGLEIDGSLLKGAQLSLVKNIPTIDNLFEQGIEPVNPLDFRTMTRQYLPVTALESDEVLIRALDIKLKKEKDIDAVLIFQAEPLLPFPVENAVLDRIFVSKEEDGTQVTLLAARKDYVKQHVEKWGSLQVDPEVVSCVPIALAFYSKLVVPSDAIHFVLQLGRSWTTCILVKDGKLIASQSTHMGFETITEAFAKERIEGDVSTFDFTQLSEQSHPYLYGALDGLQREITRLLSALSKQNKTFEASDILITGEGMSIAAALAQKIGKKQIEPTIPAGFQAHADKLARFAVPIGAALSALAPAKGQINFRQQELAYPQPWKRLKQPLGLYALLCVALAAACYFFGSAYIGSQEDALRQDFVSLLATMNKPYPAFEKEYEKKAGVLQGNDENFMRPEQLSPSDINARMMFLQKDIKDIPDAFPLQPNVPRVSDVLAWLSTHPNIAGSAKGTAEDSSPLLQIDSFSYTMLKRPELKKKQEKYQVKVEIEFSAPTAKHAREFHDALIAPNDLVDPKGEVKWNANKGKYRASFFLKDKTVYQ